MNNDVEFATAGEVLLRAAVLPLPPGGSTRPAPPSDRPEDPDRLRDRVVRLAADPVLMAAVRLASPSLADKVRRAVAGEPLKPQRLRRLAVSLAKYQLRMAHRATPFGFFAGVALAGFGNAVAAEWGGRHRSVSRPDAGWLDAVVTTLLAGPGVLERTRLVANNLHTVRDGRLVLLDRHDGAGAQQLAHSVRMTAVVRRAMERAAEPIAWADLVTGLAEQSPRAPDGAVERAVRQLTRSHFLLSDLAPPPDCTTPLGHVLDRLDGCDHPLADALRAVHATLEALDAAPPDGREAALTTATERMRALHPAEDLIQSDLALDARVVLPQEVAREAERAASALWRTSLIRPGSPHLRDYHLAFLERYGTERAVPVLELLDPGRGLGLPDAYRKRPAPRPEPHPGTERRDRVLGELFLAATRHTAAGDTPEVVLDDEALRALSPEEPRALPACLELGAELFAASRQALSDGDFRLVLGANPGSPLAGATFSRFAPVLGEDAARVRNLIRRGRAGAPEGERTACVAYRPRVMRSANVATVPQWLTHRIPLGVGPAAAEGTEDLRLADLAVRADLEGLRLVDLRTGRRVRPVSYSMLNPGSGHLPQTARFLLELGQEGQDWCLPWNWGAWSAAPVQPRVTYGRTVLAPARWLPDRALRDAAAAGGRPWAGQVATWRRRWGVPRHVQLTRADNHIPVDLDDPLHLLLFQEELKRAKGLSVVERFDGEQGGGWLSGPDGGHAAELVIPLLARPARKAPAPAPAPPPLAAARSRGSHAHVPGGEWLYAKLYVPEPFQAQVLTRHLHHLTDPAVLAAAGADTWFFLRYADPDAHLRLRVHGKPAQLWPVLLPQLRLWAEGLRDAGLAGRLVLDTYDPEIERYGGSAAQAHVERLFHTDSAVVTHQLALSEQDLTGVPDRTTLAALGILDILTRLATENEALGLLGSDTVLARRGEVPRDHKDALAALLDPGGRPRPPGASADLTARWADRAAALAELQQALATTAPGTASRAQIALSLAHMHCNRLLGIRQDEEVLAHATAREALALRLGRRRHGR